MILPTLPQASVDALVTDPPAAISFMGRSWDHDHGGREHWVRAFAAIFAECLRVLKPGAHGFVWALPRTAHWTATALEDAGFEVRDVITHHFGSGFPKSLDVSKAIDKAAGIHRGQAGAVTSANAAMSGPNYERAEKGSGVTAAAAAWDGWGTALKPATEHWLLVRKPLAEGTVAANVLAHGTGALNVDACRVGTDVIETTLNLGMRGGNFGRAAGGASVPGASHVGRWPANLLLSHAEGCEEVGTREVKSSTLLTSHELAESENAAMSGKNYARHPRRDYAPDGTETVAVWRCVPGCPVAELNRQSGEAGAFAPVRGTEPSKDGFGGAIYGTGMTRQGGAFYGDTGGASRFFPTFRYEPKAPGAERTHDGEVENKHPTVKPVALMRWLCRLVTPRGGTVLDPFMGSGSTGVACAEEGFDFLGIEREPEYHAIAGARIADATRQGNLFNAAFSRRSGVE